MSPVVGWNSGPLPNQKLTKNAQRRQKKRKKKEVKSVNNYK